MPIRVYDMVLEEALELDPEEQLELIEALTRHFRGKYTPPPPVPGQSLRGIAKHLGPCPSAEDIDEARQEVWANFPREDIA